MNFSNLFFFSNYNNNIIVIGCRELNKVDQSGAEKMTQRHRKTEEVLIDSDTAVSNVSRSAADIP